MATLTWSITGSEEIAHRWIGTALNKRIALQGMHRNVPYWSSPVYTMPDGTTIRIESRFGEDRIWIEAAPVEEKRQKHEEIDYLLAYGVYGPYYMKQVKPSGSWAGMTYQQIYDSYGWLDNTIQDFVIADWELNPIRYVPRNEAYILKSITTPFYTTGDNWYTSKRDFNDTYDYPIVCSGTNTGHLVAGGFGSVANATSIIVDAQGRVIQTVFSGSLSIGTYYTVTNDYCTADSLWNTIWHGIQRTDNRSVNVYFSGSFYFPFSPYMVNLWGSRAMGCMYLFNDKILNYDEVAQTQFAGWNATILENTNLGTTFKGDASETFVLSLNGVKVQIANTSGTSDQFRHGPTLIGSEAYANDMTGYEYPEHQKTTDDDKRQGVICGTFVTYDYQTSNGIDAYYAYIYKEKQAYRRYPVVHRILKYITGEGDPHLYAIQPKKQGT